MRSVCAAACLVLLLGSARPVSAQGPPMRPGDLTISGGLVVSAGMPIGDRNAELRRNAPGAPPVFTLFRADSKIERGIGVDARLSVALTRALAVEGGFSYLRPQLAVTISGDPELDGGATVTERLSQYGVEASAVYHLTAISLGPRLRPYVLGGGGYLRQLHEDRLLAENGATIHAGGGLQYWISGGAPRQRAMGARVEARVVRRTGGIDFEDRARVYPTLGVLAFVGF